MSAGAPVGVAIVGCGAVTQLLRQPVYPRLAGRARVVAVCDPDRDRARQAAAHFGARGVYADLAEVLADAAVAAVDVCTPHALHAEHAIRALAAGRHVLVEKPLAASLADGARIVDAARRTGRVLAVNEQMHFGLALRRARELIDRGAIGRVVDVRVRRLFVLPAPYAASGWRHDPRRPDAGVLIDQGPHYVYLLRRLAGEIAHVTATAASAAAPSATLRVRFASGAAGELKLAWDVPTPPDQPEARVFGTEGRLEIGRPGAALVWHRDANAPRSAAGTPGRVLRRDDYLEAVQASLADFFAAAGGGAASVAVPGDEGLRDLAVLDAALRSIASGAAEPVVVPA